MLRIASELWLLVPNSVEAQSFQNSSVKEHALNLMLIQIMIVGIFLSQVRTVGSSARVWLLKPDTSKFSWVSGPPELFFQTHA